MPLVSRFGRDHDQGRHPVDADALGDRRVAGDLARPGRRRRRRRGSAAEALDAAADEAVVDAAVADEEQDDGPSPRS